MGVLTHAQIVTEALELAGNTSLTTRAQTWLGLVLRELIEKFPVPVVPQFPTLDTPASTPGLTTLTAGVQSIQLGGAGGLVAGLTVRSVRRVWVCTNGQTDFSELFVEHISTMDMPPRSYTGVSGVARGRPTRVIASVLNTNSVTLFFDPIPDKTYALWVMSEGWLDAAATYNVAQVNLYPNDMTVVQGVYAWALKHQADERFPGEWGDFLRMQREDRTAHLQANGAFSRMRLSARSFLPRSRRRNPWDWMGPK